MGFPALGFGSALVIVGVASDVRLLPVAKGDFEHTHSLVAAATQPVLFIGTNPDFVACLANAFGFTDLHEGVVIDYDPQLCAGRVRLQAQALARQHSHQADGALAVKGVLLERAPRTGDDGDRRLVGGDRLGLGHGEVSGG